MKINRKGQSNFSTVVISAVCILIFLGIIYAMLCGVQVLKVR